MSTRVWTFIIIMSILMLLIGKATVAKNESDLVTIAEIVEKEKTVTMEDWSVFAREQITVIKTKEDFAKKVQALQNLFPQFDWIILDDDTTWKAKASYSHVEDVITETITIVSTKEHNDIITYIIYEVSGEKWNNGTSPFLHSIFEDRKKDIFRGNPSVFSCIRGSFSGNMDSVLTAEKTRLLDLFEATVIEGVQEEQFSSISAHSPFFTQTLTDEQINLQIGLRKDGLSQKTSFVIGTPIITFEY